jgi:hypothetical protein
MPYNLYAHQDVLEALQNRNALGKRLNLVFSHLSAHGRTSVVKSCKDPINRGWLRTPVSGNNRYLWWARHSSNQVEGAGFPEHSIVLRAVRHHDDHGELLVEDFENHYAPITPKDLNDDAFIELPWTEPQNNFIHSNANVRILIGNPGSGKTTALWRTVQTRESKKVLYLTWSSRLASTAKEHFDCFRIEGLNVVARDIRSFWGEILARNVVSIDPEQSFKHFKTEVSKINPQILGPWKQATRALHAEARAVFYGMAIPEPGALVLEGLNAESYLKIRHDDLGNAAEMVSPIIGILRPALDNNKWMPELEAAFDVIRHLREKEIPPGWDDFDSIVVDEVQDMTQLEIRALLDFHACLATNRDTPPNLTFAGDEGQTVVPTHFKWGRFKNNLEDAMKRLAPNRTPGTGVQETHLDSNLRCPINVRNVLDQAGTLYTKLRKHERPGNQTPPLNGELHDARLIHAKCQNASQAKDLLSQLMDIDGLAVICLNELIRKEISRIENGGKSIGQRILMPDEAKGLEFQTVCLLNPGTHLRSFEELIGETNEIDNLAARTHLDQFRVAISRATGDLVFLDIGKDENAYSESKNILGAAIETDAEGLLRFFEDFDVTPETRVQSRLNLARELEEQDIHRAWSITVEAFKMLGDKEITNGVSDEELRSEAGMAILTQAAILLVNPAFNQRDTERIQSLVQEAAKEARSEASSCLFQAFIAWVQCDRMANSDKAAVSAIKLLESIEEAAQGAEWLMTAIGIAAQRLRIDMLAAPATKKAAESFTGPVERWLEITGDIGDLDRKAIELRSNSIKTLIKAGNLKKAEEIFALIPEDKRLSGMIHEAYKRYAEAALCFEAAGETTCALRNWRADGNWEKSIEHATGDELQRLVWLKEIQDISSRKPHEMKSWMTKAETKRFKETLKYLE